MDAIRELLHCASDNLPAQARAVPFRQAATGFKAAGSQGSRVLARLIEDLVHSRSRAARLAVEAACEADPTPELISALRRIAWAGLRRSGQRGRFEPELTSQYSFVGWSPETHKAVRTLAARALHLLSPDGDPPPAAEPDSPPPASTPACSVCARTVPLVKTLHLYSARVLPSEPGVLPDYRELRLHFHGVCASCSGRRRRRWILALAVSTLSAVLAFLLRASGPLLAALSASAVLGLVWLLAACRASVSTRLERRALQERRAAAPPGPKSDLRILGQQVVDGPYLRPEPSGASREASCDVCGRQIAYREGYCLSTSQVVAEPRYWEYAFTRAWSRYRECDPRGAEVTALAREQAGRSTAWLVCETCMGRFSANRENARFQCRARWERESDASQEMPGPADPQAALRAARAGWELASDPRPAASPGEPGPPQATE